MNSTSIAKRKPCVLQSRKRLWGSSGGGTTQTRLALVNAPLVEEGFDLERKIHLK